MFGYIRPVRNDCENYLFRAQYCGLCKTLGKRYAQFSRLFLSYDISLLTLLWHALSGKNFVYKYETCIMHPVNKRRVKRPNEIDQTAADVSVYFVKKKIEDNIRDERWFKKLLYQGLNKIPMKWNRETLFKYDDLDNLFYQLERMEELKKPEIDELSNCFGTILKKTTRYASRQLYIKLPDETEQFTFFLGKLIYTLDAFEDLERDLKKWNYNPLIFENKEVILSVGKTEEVVKKIKDKEKWRLYLLLDHLEYIYSLFNDCLGVYRSEIDGIISKSLPAMVYRVLGQKSNCQKKGVLHE